ncbi:uroporphyrinogen-III synthase [Sutcliffiella cohnii]
MKSRLPLANKRIVITRSKEQAVDFSNRIEQLGGTVITVPLIQFSFPKKVDILQNELAANVQNADVIVFTSVNGVDFFHKLYNRKINAQIAAVGTKTRKALQNIGLETTMMPNFFTAEHLVETLKEHVPLHKSILLIQGNLARPVLREQLQSLGYNVKQMIVYENKVDEQGVEALEQLKKDSVDMITFTSPSTVHSFLSRINQNEVNAKVAVIGPITKNAAEKAGLSVHVCPPEDYTTDGLIREIVAYYYKEETKI